MCWLNIRMVYTFYLKINYKYSHEIWALISFLVIFWHFCNLGKWMRNVSAQLDMNEKFLCTFTLRAVSQVWNPCAFPMICQIQIVLILQCVTAGAAPSFPHSSYCLKNILCETVAAWKRTKKNNFATSLYEFKWNKNVWTAREMKLQRRG